MERQHEIDGDFTAHYLRLLGRAAHTLSIRYDKDTVGSLTYHEKRVVRLAMSVHISEIAEEVIDIYNGIPGTIAEGHEHFFKQMWDLLQYLMNVLRRHK